MITETVPTALAGERLDRVVAFIADLSRATAAETILLGGVRVDGELAMVGKTRVRIGQTVTVDPDVVPVDGPPEPEPDLPLPLVHVDDEVIVVDKPAGMVVHPGAGNSTGTLVNALLSRFPEIAEVGDALGDVRRPGIVHRLDAGSSGLLVVARTVSAARSLIEQFAERTASRRYVALVWGHPAVAHGVIDAPIGRDPRDPVRMAVITDGREARTEYVVQQRFRRPTECALVECRLETGRTHQIRVHLASIGHPLIGDPTYAERRPAMGLERPFLHAVELRFEHPGTGSAVEFSSELPVDLREVLARCES